MAASLNNCQSVHSNIVVIFLLWLMFLLQTIIYAQKMCWSWIFEKCPWISEYLVHPTFAIMTACSRAAWNPQVCANLMTPVIPAWFDSVSQSFLWCHRCLAFSVFKCTHTFILLLASSVGRSQSQWVTYSIWIHIVLLPWNNLFILINIASH